MRRLTVIATAAALVLCAVFTLNVAAQQPDTHDRTIMTFSSAVELPGVRLDGGTYVFRIADTPSRNVIQVLTQDEMQMLGQWLFVPAERQEVTGDTVVTFREERASTTPAVQYWFYPGEKIGKEFIYPKDQALRIAQRTGATVLTEEGPVGTSGSAESSTSTQAETQIAPAQEQGAVAVQHGAVEGSGLPEDQQAVGTSGRAEQTASERQESTAARNQYAQNELPRTASPIAFSGLLGLLSLVGAAGIRMFRL